MKVFKESDRIVLRELLPSDKDAMFEMDSDPEVHKYLWQNPITRLEQAEATIAFVRAQYIEHGIGRWAIVEKESNQFVGWGGLKLITTPINGHVNFYDVGYRLLRRFWGKGYATESAKLSVQYAFEELHATAVYAMADPNNLASRNALEKTGLKIDGHCEYEGLKCDWFELSREDCLMNNKL